jgi:phage protein D
MPILTPYYRVTVKNSEVELTNYITNLSFSDSISESDVLTMSMNGVPLSLLNEKELSEGVILVFRFGYMGGANSLNREARISNLDYTYGKTINLNIKATDLGIKLKKGERTTLWENKTVREIVDSIAKKNGMQVIAETTINGVDVLNKKIDSLPQTLQSDLSIIQKALSITGSGSLIVFTTGNTIVIKKRALNDNSVRKFTYNSDNSVIISFKPSARDTERLEGSKKTSVTAVNPFTGETVTVSSETNTTAGETSLGNYDIVYDPNALRLGETETKDVGTDYAEIEKSITAPVYSQEEAQVKSDSEKIESSLNDAKATLSILGDPTLKADGVITLEGVAQRHSGNWYINKTVHNITTSGYITKLELCKNASNRSHIDNPQKTENTNNTEGETTENAENTKEVEVFEYDNNGKRLL